MTVQKAIFIVAVADGLSRRSLASNTFMVPKYDIGEAWHRYTYGKYETCYCDSIRENDRNWIDI